MPEPHAPGVDGQTTANAVGGEPGTSPSAQALWSRHRRRLLIYLSVGVVAALAALCTAGAIKSDSDAAPGEATFSTPQQIGSLKRSADQSAATTLLASLNAMGPNKTFAVIYDDTATEGHHASAWGISSWQLRNLSLQRRLDLFFSSASQHLNDSSLGVRVDVDPGTIAGKAQCASVESSPEVMTACAWAEGKATTVAFLFTGKSPNECGDLLRRMLSAIVTKG